MQEQDKRYEKIEKNQRKLMAELKKDILQTVDAKIDTRMEQAMQKVQGLVDEANKAAAEAKAAVEKTAGAGGQSSAQGTPRSSASGRASPWTPRTLEVKGFCEWARRFADGVSSEFAEDFLSRLRDDLGEAGKQADWDRSVEANRFAYNYKLVIVLRGGDDDSGDRSKIYDLKDQVAQRLRREDFFINKRACFVVTQASPERRELFALAGRFTTALTATSADSGLVTKREYAAASITILVWRQASEDKNSHLGQRSGPTGGGGRWLRVAEWTARQKDWRLFDGELASIGVDSSQLLGGVTAGAAAAP